MVLKIILYHIICYLTGSDAKVASGPKMPAPISLFNHWEFLKKFRGGSAFDPSHNFTRRHGWWCRHKYVNMIFTHNTFDDSYFKRLTSLPHKFPYPKGYITFQHVIPVFCYPYKMVLNIENRMTTVSIFHKPSFRLLEYHNLNDKSIRLKGGGFNLL